MGWSNDCPEWDGRSTSGETLILHYLGLKRSEKLAPLGAAGPPQPLAEGKGAPQATRRQATGADRRNSTE